MTVVATLSTSGWVRNIAEKADFLLSHFYESDKFQTYLYGRNICNIQWLIEQYGHDPIKLCAELQQALLDYFNRHVDSALVEVTTDDNAFTNAVPNESGSIGLRLYVRLTESGKDYTLNSLIMMKNSKFDKIIQANNEGTL